MSKAESLTALFDLTLRLFSDDAATATVEAELDAMSDAVSPSERGLLAVARPLLVVSTPLIMLASVCASFVAAYRFEQTALVLAAVILPFVLAWPARALRRSAKRQLLRAAVQRARARLTVDTRAIFASPAIHEPADLFVVPEPATTTTTETESSERSVPLTVDHHR